MGLTKAASGPADVVVMYYSLRRTDVDVKAKPDASGARPQFAVGTLAVALFDPSKKKQLLHMRLDKPIDTDPTHLQFFSLASLRALLSERFSVEEIVPTRGRWSDRWPSLFAHRFAWRCRR